MQSSLDSPPYGTYCLCHPGDVDEAIMYYKQSNYVFNCKLKEHGPACSRNTAFYAAKGVLGDGARL
jgi:hypothetical protein